jgi:hypothetical protein
MMRVKINDSEHGPQNKIGNGEGEKNSLEFFSQIFYNFSVGIVMLKKGGYTHLNPPPPQRDKKINQVHFRVQIFFFISTIEKKNERSCMQD